MEALIRDMKAVVGVVEICRTPAVSSLGRCPLVLSLLQREARLSQSALKCCSVIARVNSFVVPLHIPSTISEDGPRLECASAACAEQGKL